MPTARRIVLTLAALALPGQGHAHAAERMVILTMPTRWHVVGAAGAVLLTALAAAAARARPRLPVTILARPGPRRAAPAARHWISTGLFLALIAIGFFGTADPFANLLVMAIWVGLWIVLPLAAILLGNLAPLPDPWSAPATALRRAAGRTATAPWLWRLRRWPAALGLLALAWMEIVSPAPTDPPTLARACLAYWLAVLALTTLAGPAWRARNETFAVFFTTLTMLSPLWRTRAHILLGPPGFRIARTAPLDTSGIAFVSLMLAAVTFDGLSESFWWLARLGLNPLEFPGRSAVIAQNTAGLLATWGCLVAALLAAARLAARLACAPLPAGRAMRTLIPIAAGYHLAHYLVALLTTGQNAIAALSDPLALGWNLLGLPRNWVSFAAFTDFQFVRAIWNIQVALILGAHLLAVLLGQRELPPRAPLIAHLPGTLLMVALTMLGLWLLSTPTGA